MTVLGFSCDVGWCTTCIHTMAARGDESRCWILPSITLCCERGGGRQFHEKPSYMYTVNMKMLHISCALTRMGRNGC